MATDIRPSKIVT